MSREMRRKGVSALRHCPNHTYVLISVIYFFTALVALLHDRTASSVAMALVLTSSLRSLPSLAHVELLFLFLLASSIPVHSLSLSSLFHC